MNVQKGEPVEFGLLQMRPLVISNEIEELEVDHYQDKNLLCRSDQVLGHGVIANIKDIVFVDIEKFDRRHTVEKANEIARFNAKMINDDVPYLLIGLGRWGTMDSWLGIPVKWEQILSRNNWN